MQVKDILFRGTIVIVFSLWMQVSYGQSALPPIQTDRPDQTECPFIVPKKHVQVETGFNYEKVNEDESGFVYPTILWKYGMNDKFELRMITELSTSRILDKRMTSISPVKLGFKTSLSEEKGILPKTSFIAHLSIPGLATSNAKATYYAPDFRFTMQHSLSERVSLGYNLGAEWDGESAEPIFVYTITTGFSLSEKIGAYTELYGFAPQRSKADHRADLGFTWLLKQNMMLDISGGFGISPNAPRYYFSLGYSVRLKD